MNPKNNLQYALNKAFENHTEPLNEAMWARLEGAIVVKPKRRFWPFFYITMLVCFTSGIAILAAYNYGLNQNKIMITASPEKLISEKNSGITFNDLQLTAPQSSHSNTTYPNSNARNSNSEYFVTKYYKTKKGNNTPSSKLPILLKSLITDNNTSETYTGITLLAEDNGGKALQTVNGAKNTEIKNPLEEIPKPEVVKANDTIYLSSKEEPEKLHLPPSRYSFSLAGGYAKMNFKVLGIENNNKLHQDTRQLFEQSNRNPKTTFINFGFDLSVFPKLRIGINTGIQYLRIETPLNINYQLTQIPVRSQEGIIIGYATRSPIDLISSATNYTTYINFPLRLNYSVSLTSKHEIIFTSGTNISALAAAKGKSININGNPEIKSVSREMYSPLNLGFVGGFQYNTQLKNKWWLGMESLWQTTPMKFKVGSGSIKNKLEGYNVNFIIKYKI